MTDAAPRRRGLLVPAVFTLAVLAVLVGLGTWQVERKVWKEGLIAELDAKLGAAPLALPPPDRWAEFGASADEFRRVRFAAEFSGEEALVYSSGSSLRPDVSGPGYWVFAPARLAGGGTVVVNRGFVPEGKQDPKSHAPPSGPTDIVGSLRWSEQRGLFTPADTPAKNLWFARDPAGMAAAKRWGAIAPFYVDQEAPVPAGGLPKPGPLRASLPNNHLQYAITWYGLALATFLTALFFFRAQLRRT